MSSKKRNHISYIKSSKLYQARYTVTFPDGTRKRQAVYGKTLQEAKEKYNKAVAKAIIGDPIRTSNQTVEQYLNNWVQTVRNIKESTRLKYAGELNKYVIPNIGHTRLSTLNTDKIQNMMNKIAKEGASPRTSQIVKNILSRAFRSAEAQNLVPKNIMHYVEIDSYTPKARLVWSKEESEIFLNAAKGTKYYLFYLLYITYGLRRGEAIPLTWKDIDFDNNVIHISKQFTYCGNQTIECDPKTKNSIRDLPLLPHIRTELEKLAKTKNSKTDLIVSVNNTYVKPTSINYEFKKITRKANLPEVVLHSLRHFAATMFKESGINVKEAQEILGHASSITTLQIYTHSSLESKQEALEKYVEKMCFGSKMA